MAENWMEQRWWERSAAFINDHWWKFLLGIIAALVLFFTRCLWYEGFCPTRLTITNSSPYELTVVLTGSETKTIPVPPCLTCQVYSQPGPSECPAIGTKTTEKVDAGVYALVAQHGSDPTNPLAYTGSLTIIPQQLNKECFFVFENGFAFYDPTGSLQQSTPVATEAVEVAATAEPTITALPITWLAYQNDSMGISLKYPDTWYGEESDSLISFNTENNNHVEVTKTALPDGITQEEYTASMYSTEDFTVGPGQVQEINGLSWLVTTARYNDLASEIVTYTTMDGDEVVTVKYFRPASSADPSQTADAANFDEMMQSLDING
jgi:hypothetical protein